MDTLDKTVLKNVKTHVQVVIMGTVCVIRDVNLAGPATIALEV